MNPQAPSRDELELFGANLSVWLIQAFRSGCFAEAYAELYADVPLPRAERVAIGHEVAAMFNAKSPNAKIAILDRIGRRLEKQYLHGEANDPALLEFVQGFYHWADAKREIGRGCACDQADLNKLSLAFGAVCGYVKARTDEGATEDIAALADHAAEFVPHVLEGISATTARRATKELTRYVALKDWLNAHWPGPRRGALH
jgi:hypothetical protein